MNEQTVVGLCPWLPWPLCRWPWWTEPVRAERLAVLRIGLAAVLLIDLLTTYLPGINDFYGSGSLGSPELFAYLGKAPKWYWSILRGVEEQRILLEAMILWTLATACLLLGLCTRLSVLVVWVLSTSFANLNPYIENAGDEVRGIILVYLLLSPCGAAWSVDSWLRRRRSGNTEPVFIHPWPLRLLFVQMTFIYFVNGMFKLSGQDWRSGASLYYVLGDLTLARWSYAQVPLPYPLTRLLSWTVLGWEVGFPLLMALPWLALGLYHTLRIAPALGEPLVTSLRWLRVIALCFGASFHLGIWLAMELGMFAPYMLCLYMPLLPWERWTKTTDEHGNMTR